MGLYRDYETTTPTVGVDPADGLAPAWLARPAGKLWLGAFGDVKDDLVDAAVQAVKARSAMDAPADALPLLGAERQLVRGATEDETTFRARVLAAWDLWRFGGTAYGLLRALATAGYPTATIQTQTAKQYQLDGSPRTNLAPYSTQFDNAAWTKIASTVTPNMVKAPDGTPRADKLCDDSSPSTFHRLRWIPSTALVAGTTYTFSLYMKPGERTGSEFTIGTTRSQFDLVAGTVLMASGVDSASIASVGGGWFRCQATFTSVGSESIHIKMLLAGADIYSGDTGAGLFIFGAQLELGTTATAHIESFTPPASDIDLVLDANGDPTMVTQDLTGPVHLGGAPAELWSDFGILIQKPWPARWSGAAPADGTSEQRSFSALVAAWKPAHARCVKITVVNSNLWGFGGLTWGGASLKWGGGTSTSWTPPVG